MTKRITYSITLEYVWDTEFMPLDSIQYMNQYGMTFEAVNLGGPSGAIITFSAPQLDTLKEWLWKYFYRENDKMSYDETVTEIEEHLPEFDSGLDDWWEFVEANDLPIESGQGYEMNMQYFLDAVGDEIERLPERYREIALDEIDEIFKSVLNNWYCVGGKVKKFNV